jgi:hypothetical protein
MKGVVIMSRPPQSKLDRELEEILTKKSKERAREPIPFHSHPNAPKTKGTAALGSVREMAGSLWYPLVRMPLLFAFVLVFAAWLVSDLSPLLALLLCAWAVGSLWWPGIKRLMGPADTGKPDVKYWRGRPYSSELKDVVSRHPVDSLKRYFDRRR